MCALAIAAATASSPLAASGDLTSRLAKALRSPHVSLERTSAIAIDARTGTIVYAHNETLPVVPASNEKLPVSWAALSRLGPGYRFATELYGTGSRSGSVWHGNLYLKGHGDPTLASSGPRAVRPLDPRSRPQDDPGTRSRRRVGFRHAARWPRLEGAFPRPRVGAALRARRRSCPRLARPLTAAPRRAEPARDISRSTA